MSITHLEGTRVLIAEHELVAREWIDQELRDQGADVVDVSDGRALLSALVSDGPFDAVILDLASSDLPGAEVVALTRSAGLDVPFILLATHELTHERPTPHTDVDRFITVMFGPPDALAIVHELDHVLEAPHVLDLSKCVFVACAACGRPHIADLWPPSPSFCGGCADRIARDGATEELPAELGEDPYDELGNGD